jgi:aldehyde dehydrogenase (NAD+)
MGGKNAQIVLADADLELAVEGALWGAFGTSGQRCTATSRIILERPIAEKFQQRFLERAAQLRVGNGADPQTQVGPIINRQQLERVEGYVRLGEAEGAKIVLGGQPLTDGPLAKGSFYAPTVFTQVSRTMRIAREEIFGPVVCLMTADSFEEAVSILNDTPYGLSSSIYTADVQRAFEAIEQIEAGITYVNGPTIGAEVHLPFGGVKQTGNGHREAGQAALDTFSEWKAVYVDYSGRLQRAQIDNYDSPSGAS